MRLPALPSLPPSLTFEHIWAESIHGWRIIAAQAARLVVIGVLNTAGTVYGRAIIVGAAFAAFNCKTSKIQYIVYIKGIEHYFQMYYKLKGVLSIYPK